MNSDILLLSGSPDAVHRLDRARGWLAAFEARYSRFRVLSELSRLNAAAGRPFRASRSLFSLVELALNLARRSEGLFDPTVLPDLLAAGYDRSFEQIGASQRGPSASRRRTTWRDVRLDTFSRMIELPRGGGIDLGGIGKGWAVDRMAAILGSPCLVDGGGDVFAAGQPDDAPAWRVGIADPFLSDGDIAILELCDRGVATSSILRRRWQAGELTLHHLIDPRTGHPSTSDAVQVTAISSSALLSDFHAKVALLLGLTEGLAYLEREPDVEGLIVSREGVVIPSNGLNSYLLQDDSPKLS